MSTTARSLHEATLRQWVKKSSDNEEARRDLTEKQIREAFAKSTRLKGPKPSIYVKGSYANNTNVRLDYDVDIAVECQGFYYFDDTAAEADVRLAMKSLSNYGGPYSGIGGQAEFKRDVELTLTDYFGTKPVERGNLSLRVRENKTTLPADIVPCFTYHYVHGKDWYGKPAYYVGTRLYPDQGAYIHNWPKQQYDCGVAKNNATGKRYKRMVRALKRVENKLVAAGTISELPSFFMECLVYNVPNSSFGHTDYLDDMRAVLANIFNATLNKDACDKWLEASERKWLFHPSQGWTFGQAHALAGAAWDYFGFQ